MAVLELPRMLHDVIYTNYLDLESSTDVVARNSAPNVYERIITGDNRVRSVRASIILSPLPVPVHVTQR